MNSFKKGDFILATTNHLAVAILKVIKASKNKLSIINITINEKNELIKSEVQDIVCESENGKSLVYATPSTILELLRITKAVAVEKIQNKYLDLVTQKIAELAELNTLSKNVKKVLMEL
jgi:hypothetical protein